MGEVAWCASPGRCPGRSRARQAQRHTFRREIIKVWPGRRPMVLLLVKSRNVHRWSRVSESSAPAFLAENSAGWETSAPIRPERQGIAAGPALDQQLQSRAPWTHADLGCLAGAAACARRSIERPRGGFESKRKSQPLRHCIRRAGHAGGGTAGEGEGCAWGGGISWFLSAAGVPLGVSP